MKKTKLGQSLMEALNEAIEHAQGKIDFRTTKLTLPDEPPKMSKKRSKKSVSLYMSVSRCLRNSSVFPLKL